MIREGTLVTWDWGKGTAEGSVKKVYKEDVEKTIKGNHIKREASEDCPAYLIEQDDGSEVIKSSTEVSRKSS